MKEDIVCSLRLKIETDPVLGTMRQEALCSLRLKLISFGCKKVPKHWSSTIGFGVQ